MGSQGRARAALLSLAVVSAAVLAWSLAHWLTTEAADLHVHLHEHGLVHGHDALLDAQRRLDHVHAYLAPTVLGAGLALLASLAGLWALPSQRSSGPGRTSRGLVAGAAALSASVFGVVETVEHAVAVGTGPPVALLAVGAVVHALVGAGAQVLTSRLLGSIGARHSPALALPAGDRLPSQPAPQGAFSRMWIGRLAGRAPPAGAARLALS